MWKLNSLLVGILLAFITSGLAHSQTATTPIASASAENNHILRASPGRLYNLFVANQVATAGFVVVLNQTTVPADGAITPLLCVNIAASGTAQLNLVQRPAAFNTGIVVVITSAANCFTKTTGVITGFISGMVD